MAIHIFKLWYSLCGGLKHTLCRISRTDQRFTGERHYTCCHRKCTILRSPFKTCLPPIKILLLPCFIGAYELSSEEYRNQVVYRHQPGDDEQQTLPKRFSFGKLKDFQIAKYDKYLNTNIWILCTIPFGGLLIETKRPNDWPNFTTQRLISANQTTYFEITWYQRGNPEKWTNWSVSRVDYSLRFLSDNFFIKKAIIYFETVDFR